jgi:DNA-binding CsgD family transcriptional regulator
VARVWLARLGLADLGDVLDDLGRRWCPDGPATPPLPSQGVFRDCLLLTALAEASLCEGRFADGAGYLGAAMRLTGGSETTLARSSLPLRAVDLRARALGVLCGVGDRSAFERLAAGLEERDLSASRSLAGSAVNPFTVVRLARAFLSAQEGDEQHAVLELARAEAGAADADPLFPVICAAARAWLALTTDDPAQAAAAAARVRVRVQGDGSVIPPWLGIVLWGAEIAASTAEGVTAAPEIAHAVTALDGIDLRAPGVSRVLGFVAPLVAPFVDPLVATAAASGEAPSGDRLPGQGPDDGEASAAESTRSALVTVGRALLAEALATSTAAGADHPPGRHRASGPSPARPGVARSGAARSGAAGSGAGRSGSARTGAAGTGSTRSGPATTGSTRGGSAVRAQRTTPAERVAARSTRSAEVVALPEPLTPRELDVLQYLDGPAHYDNIAEELFLSRNTVKTHVKAVYRKLGVNGRVAAVKLARELGLLAER